MAILVHKRVSPLEPIFEIRLYSAASSGLHYVRDIRHAPINNARVQRKDARICEPRVQIVGVDGQGRIFAITIIRMVMWRLIVNSYSHLRMRNPCIENLIPLFGSQMRHRLLLYLFLDHISDSLYAIESKRRFPLPSICVIRLTVLVDRIFGF
jgi:hypothetical protein